MLPELLTIAEAAAALRLKPSTIRAWILVREIEFCKIGRLVRIPRTAVENFIAKATVPAGEKP